MRYWIHLLLIHGLLLPTLAVASVLKVAAERIDSASVEATQLELSVDWPDAAERGELVLGAQTLRFGDTGVNFKALRWRCELVQLNGGWRCEGSVDAAGMRQGRLFLSSTDAGTGGELSNGKSRLSVNARATQPALMDVQVTQLPVDWLQPLLAKVWPEATLTHGSLTARFEIPIDANSLRAVGSLDAQKLSLDTADGRIAAAGLSYKGALRLELGSAVEVALDGQLLGAELLAGSTYIELPPSPIDFAFNAKGETADVWTISAMRWGDGQALQLAGDARLDLSRSAWLDRLQLTAESANLADFNTRYLQSLLASAGMPKASAVGHALLTIDIGEAGKSAVALTFRDGTADSGDGRLSVAGLNGGLRWTTYDIPQASRLDWRAINVYGIALGPAQLDASSQLGDFRMTKPVVVTAVGGTLELQQLRWQPSATSNADDSQFELALALSDLDLASLSAQFGWPPFAGKLSGRLPKASYVGDTLSLDGALEIEVFDGQLRIDGLALERPFGVAPTLGGNIAMRGLDLQPLTAAFGFGEITGRMDGDIGQLRLVDWEPVAFDAHFRTVARKGVKRRISQRAVNDLSSVGGGLAGGLQSSALRVFDSFGYSKIALGCRLRNDVCQMRGIEGAEEAGSEAGSSGAGYTVVEGSGLPRITVNGFARQVDWPVLVARLKAVSEGQSPRIE